MTNDNGPRIVNNNNPKINKYKSFIYHEISVKLEIITQIIFVRKS